MLCAMTGNVVIDRGPSVVNDISWYQPGYLDFSESPPDGPGGF
jgi:hypothetical protein